MIRKLSFWLVKKYRHSTIPQTLILLIDVALFIAAFFLMEAFRTYGIADITTHGTLIKFIWSMMLTVIFFLFTGSFRGIIRHAGMSDIYKIVVSCIGPLAICWIANILNNQFTPPIVRDFYMLSYRESLTLYLILGMLMIISRMFMQRIYNEFFRRRRPTVNVVIYGAGAAGLIAYNALKQESNFEYKVVAFIDDDMSKVNQELNGVPVMRVRSVLNQKFVENKKISQLIIAIPTIRMLHKQAITNKALDLGMTVKAVPHVSTWLNGSFTVNQIQDIKIEDLLEREPIRMDNVNIVREVVDKVILVTGAAGSIGSEICRQLMTYQPKKVIMLDQAESPMYDLQFELKNTYKDNLDRMEFVIANVKDRQRMEEVFELYHPNLVYHAAAYKHVPFMEENPYEAVYINVFGTRNLADLSIKYGVQKFVMISTDKAVNPTNVMGCSKRICEIYVQSLDQAIKEKKVSSFFSALTNKVSFITNSQMGSPSVRTQFVTTRFGNVLGSNGSVIPLFREQIKAGGPVTVTDERIVRFFMLIPEACKLVLEAGTKGNGGEIFVFDMGKPVKIADLAKRMIQLSGAKNVEVKFTGLRPGEKLYEEVLNELEGTKPTFHEKIRIAEVREYDYQKVAKEIDELIEISKQYDDMATVRKMKEIVPEYKSNNSEYEKLDK